MPQDGGQVAPRRSVDHQQWASWWAAASALPPTIPLTSWLLLTTGEAVCPGASVHVSCLPAPHPITQTLEEGARAMPSLRPDAIPVASACPSQVLGTSLYKGSSSSGLPATVGSSFLVFRFMDGRVRSGSPSLSHRWLPPRFTSRSVSGFVTLGGCHVDASY